MNYSASVSLFKQKLVQLSEYFIQRLVPEGLRQQIIISENHLWTRQQGLLFLFLLGYVFEIERWSVKYWNNFDIEILWLGVNEAVVLADLPSTLRIQVATHIIGNVFQELPYFMV